MRGIQTAATAAFAVGGALFAANGLIRGLGSLASRAQRAENAVLVFNKQLQRSNVDVNTASRTVEQLSERFGVLPETIQEASTLILRAGGSLEDVERALTAAGASAAATGFDISRSFENVATAVATGRSELLETSGIVANLGPVTQRYASSIGKTVEELTEQELIQARVNAIYEESKSEIEDVDELLEGLTGSTSRARTEFFELARELGEAVLPAVNALVGGIASLLGGLNDFIDRFSGETTRELQEFRDAVGSADDKDSLIGAVDTLAEKLGIDGVEAFQEIREEIQDGTDDLVEGKNAALDYAEALDLLAERERLLAEQAALNEVAPFLGGTLEAGADLSLGDLQGRLTRLGETDAASRLALDPDTNQLDLSRFLGAVPSENRPAAVEALRAGTLGLENIPGSGVQSREASDLITNFLRSGSFAAEPFTALTNALVENAAAIEAARSAPERPTRERDTDDEDERAAGTPDDPVTVTFDPVAQRGLDRRQEFIRLQAQGARAAQGRVSPVALRPRVGDGGLAALRRQAATDANVYRVEFIRQLEAQSGALNTPFRVDSNFVNPFRVTPAERVAPDAFGDGDPRRARGDGGLGTLRIREDAERRLALEADDAARALNSLTTSAAFAEQRRVEALRQQSLAAAARTAGGRGGDFVGGIPPLPGSEFVDTGVEGIAPEFDADDFSERFESAGERFRQESVQSGVEFAKQIQFAGEGFISAIESFQSGDVGGGIAGLGSTIGGVVSSFDPVTGAIITAGASILGGLFNLGGNDADEEANSAQSRRNLSTLELNFTFNQTNSLGLLDDPNTTRKLGEASEDAFRKFEDIVKRNINPRLDALEARI